MIGIASPFEGSDIDWQWEQARRAAKERIARLTAQRDYFFKSDPARSN